MRPEFESRYGSSFFLRFLGVDPREGPGMGVTAEREGAGKRAPECPSLLFGASGLIFAWTFVVEAPLDGTAPATLCPTDSKSSTQRGGAFLYHASIPVREEQEKRGTRAARRDGGMCLQDFSFRPQT